VTSSSPGYGLVGSDFHTGVAQTFEKLVVVIHHESGVGFGRGREVRVHAEMHHRLIALIPTPPSRRQERWLLQDVKAEQIDVKRVATLLFTRRNSELDMIQEPPHQYLRKIVARQNLVRFSEPWDHSLRSAASECARKSTRRC
jgi:hypothetical protein